MQPGQQGERSEASLCRGADALACFGYSIHRISSNTHFSIVLPVHFFPSNELRMKVLMMRGVLQWPFPVLWHSEAARSIREFLGPVRPWFRWCIFSQSYECSNAEGGEAIRLKVEGVGSLLSHFKIISRYLNNSQHGNLHASCKHLENI